MLIERATSTHSLPFSKLPNNKTDSDSTAATNEKEEISFTLATGETLAHDHEWIHQLRVGYKPPIHTYAAANTALYCTHYVYDTIIPTISTEDTYWFVVVKRKRRRRRKLLEHHQEHLCYPFSLHVF